MSKTMGEGAWVLTHSAAAEYKASQLIRHMARELGAMGLEDKAVVERMLEILRENVKKTCSTEITEAELAHFEEQIRQLMMAEKKEKKMMTFSVDLGEEASKATGRDKHGEITSTAIWYVCPKCRSHNIVMKSDPDKWYSPSCMMVHYSTTCRKCASVLELVAEDPTDVIQEIKVLVENGDWVDPDAPKDWIPEYDSCDDLLIGGE